MKNFVVILKIMFALFFTLQIIFYSQIYACNQREMNCEVNFLPADDSESVGEENKPFRIGSMSKLFTSTIILQMVDEKRIQLGTPISRFFPEIPNGEHISIEDLMISSIDIVNYLPGGKFERHILSKYVFDQLSADERRSNPISNSFNDPNYLVLGMIVEKTSGNTYAEELDKRIVNKVALTNTKNSDNNISGSTPELLDNWDLKSIQGSGSIISTINDLRIFMNALMNNQLISEKSLNNLVRICTALGISVNNLTTFPKP